MNKLRKTAKIINTVSLAIIASCLVLLTYWFCFIIQPNPSENMVKREALKSKNVSEVKILGNEPDSPFWKIDAEIQTKSDFKIRLRYVTFPLVSRKIYVSQVNDIMFSGGRVFEIKKSDKVFYEADDTAILGKMLGINLKSVNDVINQCDELYDLYELLESNSRKEFIYKEKFLLNADFRKIDEGDKS